jgi:hypothetical protein
MNRAAQIVFNNIGYTQPAIAFVMDAGALATKPNGGTYRYGYEEWNRQNLFVVNKIAYVECYRRHIHLDCNKLLLYFKDPISKGYIHYATLHNVTQLNDAQAPIIRKIFNAQNWLPIVQGHFNGAPINDPNSINKHIYIHAYNSNSIVTNNQVPGFIANIKYERFEIHEEPENLSNIDNQNAINTKWRRLVDCYSIDNMIEKLNDSNPLKEYLLNFNKKLY